MTDQPSHIVAAVATLPLPDTGGGQDQVREVTVEWLRSLRSASTRRAYHHDLVVWLWWCDRTGLDPLAADRADVDLWIAGLTGASTTLARRRYAVASWYDHLGAAGLIAMNPARPAFRTRPNQNDS